MKIGILGAGQLARMIALAGFPLGLDFIFLDPSVDACANRLGEHLHGDYSDPVLLAQLVECADVVTYEFENVPAQVVDYLAEHTKVYPPAKALEVAQDRWVEKNFFQELDIPTAKFALVSSLEDLAFAMPTLGYPAILKSRTQGYDGKGQVVLKSEADLKSAWEIVQGAPSIVEAFVPFSREVSIIAARSVSGSVVFYPLSENQHQGGILRVAECRANDPMQAQAEDYLTRLLNALDYVGVLALELFEVEGQLIANEFAPRVHNSGHWTIEGAETSQFENHLRAILDLPLGSTAAIGNAAMVNFIGGLPEAKEVLAIANAHLHLYGKSPRKGRKVAHVTVRASNSESYRNSLEKLERLATQVDDS
ncbi:N5-carboxyaminoimidazole ribonucleotide synthase PurK [Methyloglobulus morosus KoM1]|uniref:N5-carboxyaminoimidazole ribonucleotide synthase n=1 Tax=Methyloglobulus morosus KoM1 TaxID=1116472 RepID=V5BW48_9GAMM|nr:5-(carboxyamino)imidazole ribonucleotide synthase [Methyloglobulus morosus]ESS70462.1 N5-carboxyaminoimidazole ribonucleotide synthase PurK [Methyloglobulus morosus KoM1]